MPRRRPPRPAAAASVTVCRTSLFFWSTIRSCKLIVRVKNLKLLN
ncbi:hypothetical protein LINPERPRIM_LOCUS37769 [Linum perenne]